MSIETEERRVYLISPWRRHVFWPIIIGTLVVLEPVVLLGPTRNSAAIGFLLFVVLMLCGLGLQLWLSKVRLVLSSAGLKVIQIGYILETAWSNVIGVRLDRGREGFITREPLEGKGPARLAAYRGLSYNGVPMYDDQQRALLGERRLIPIEPFAWYLRRGSLKEDLIRFAPHLQADLLAGPKPVPPRTANQRRDTLMVLVGSLIGAAALGAAMLDDRVWPIVFGIFLVLGTLRSAYSARNSFLAGARALGIIYTIGTLLFAVFGVSQLVMGVRGLLPR